jgi:hypothetical protein
MAIPPKLPLSPGQTDKIGMSAQDMARGGASVPPLNPNQGDKLSSYFTYITKADGQTCVLYNGDRRWANVTLNLETAGPVAVGDKANLTGVTSGVGILLVTDEPRTFRIGKGTRIYIAATAVSRVSVAIEPIPWLEEMTAFLSQVLALLSGGRRT